MGAAKSIVGASADHGMSICWTLQRYIFREMGKTCILAALALGGVFGLGGGVLQMIKLGDVTPDQLTRLTIVVLPLSVAMTLPIALMFSATSTYGRLSVDNEFVACRSGGINIHVLFMPTVVSSLLCAAVTFAAMNYMIPGMVRNLDALLKADLPRFVEQRLNRPRGMTLGSSYRIYADDTEIDASRPGTTTLRNVAFVQVNGDEWVRLGTARQVRIEVGTGGPSVNVNAELYGTSYFDRRAGNFFESDWLEIPRGSVPPLAFLPPQVKYLTLGQLLRLRGRPSEWHEVRDSMAALRRAVGARMIYDELAAAAVAEGVLTLGAGPLRLVVTGSDVRRSPRDGQVEIWDAVVEETGRQDVRRYEATRVVFDIVRDTASGGWGIELALHEARPAGTLRPRSIEKVVLGPAAVAPELVERIQGLSDEALMGTTAASVEGDPVAEARSKAAAAQQETVRRVTAAVHERLAYAASVFGLVILGAALGIRFRGAHVVTAFGLSFVPALVVIIAIVMGRQMAHNDTTHVVGLLLIWSGIAAVGLLDVYTLKRVVRR